MNEQDSIVEMSSELTMRGVARSVIIFIALAYCHSSTCKEPNRIKSRTLNGNQTNKRNIISTNKRHDENFEIAVPIGKPKVKIKARILVNYAHFKCLFFKLFYKIVNYNGWF